MPSLASLFDAQGHLSGSTASAAALLSALNASTLRSAFAAAPIRDYHRRTGGKYGPLGTRDGLIEVLPDGTLRQQCQLGTINLLDIDPDVGGVEATTTYEVDLYLSGIKCFGTQDIGDDETFAVISLVSVDPNGTADKQSVTVRTPIQERVRPNKFLFKMLHIGTVPLTGSGMRIAISVWDHESGDADEIRDKIAEVIRDSTKRAASALAGAAAAGDPSVTAGAVGDVTEFEVGGVKPFHIITLKLAELLANALGDDLIDEHEFFIPAANIKNLADNFTPRPNNGDWDFDVQVNWPPKAENDKLLTDGAGTYKAFFSIVVSKKVTPIIPMIP